MRATIAITVSSPAFASNGTIPERFANTRFPAGRNVSIPLNWSMGPQGTRSYVIAMIDRSPVAHSWVHWLVVDIPPEVRSFPEGASRTPEMPEGARELMNTSGSLGYAGPVPPQETGEHIYEVTVFALDTDALDVSADADWQYVSAVMQDHVLASGSVMGRLGR